MKRMAAPSLLDRLKSSRLVQVLILYLGASWIVIEVTCELQDALIAWQGADTQFQPWLEEAGGWLEKVPG